MTNNKQGQIITFYSFKGGVGRTMALANVAFLAAQHGLRVLVMDWDLEAPGLAYYFRGLLDTSDVKQLTDTQGVLDILWEWSRTIKTCKTESEIKELLARFKSGLPFESCRQSLLENQGRVLDFIGAGSKSIQTPELRTYEDALTHFSWSKFFEEEAGGHVIDCLRNWAKSEYDIILVDSRTGLADAAGICTMQIPDSVALCFILNRQNIDGIAKIAAVIRAKRADEIKLRVIPMRVSRQNTSEEADARAHAISKLKRVGGFSSEAVLNDFDVISVPMAENVPFYETLAPFSAPNPNLDLLTIKYSSLATELLNTPASMPVFDLEWLESIRRRLQPRHATIEYINKLQSVDSNRMITELQRLIDSAIDDVVDGTEIDDEYISALINAVFSAPMTGDTSGLESRALDLLRILVIDKPNQWRSVLVSSIEKYLMFFLSNTEEELALYDELDGLLAQWHTTEYLLKRISYRRRVARIFLRNKELELTMQTVFEIQNRLNEVNRELTVSQEMDEIIAAKVDLSILTGDVYQLENNFTQAINEYENGLDVFTRIDLISLNRELSQLKSELHIRLALAPLKFISNLDAAKHAIEAFKWGGASPMLKFTLLANVVLNIADDAHFAIDFCEAALGTRYGRMLFSHSGRFNGSAMEFLTTITELANIIVIVDNDRSRAVLVLMIDTLIEVIQSIIRRRQVIEEKDLNELNIKVEDFIVTIKHSDLPLEKIENLKEVTIGLSSRRSRKNFQSPSPI